MKKRLQPQAVRSRFNSVTGEIEHVVLDNVQLAVERVWQVIDGRGLGLTQPEYERFVVRLAELVAGMRRQ